MHEHLWSQCYLLLSGQAHCKRKKVLFLSRSLKTTRKFNNHSSITLFFTAWYCKLTRHRCTCCPFITIAYSSCLPTFITRILFSRRCPSNACSLNYWEGGGKWGISCTTFYVDLDAMVFNDLVCIFKVGQII